MGQLRIQPVSSAADEATYGDIKVEDGVWYIRVYNSSASAWSANTPGYLDWVKAGTADTNPRLAALSVGGGCDNKGRVMVVVPQEKIAATSWGWAAWRCWGKTVNMTVPSSTYNDGYSLKLDNGIVVEETGSYPSSTAAEGPTEFAIIHDTAADGATAITDVDVYLLGYPVVSED